MAKKTTPEKEPEEADTETLLKALADAGVEVPKTATTEEILALSETLLVADEAPDPEPIPEPVAAPAEPEGGFASAQDLETVLSMADPQMGDKDPQVIAWCRDNLSPDEFKARYDGRKLPAH